MTEKPILYLDWNILSKLWEPESQNQKDRLYFQQLEAVIDGEQVIVPYSNAHMRDLSRGVVKHPEYAARHTSTIYRATGNFCIAQYWGDTQVTWHYRDVVEFLNSTVEDKDFRAESYKRLFDGLDDHGILQSLHSITVSLQRMQQLPPTFKECFKVDPVFSTMFPKTKIENSMGSLCEDIYDFTRVIMSDNVIYKQFRKFLNNAKARSMEVRRVGKEMSEQIDVQPSFLTWDEIWEKVNVKVETSKNQAYSKVVDLYSRTDLKGYKPDERFSNMIDDAIHTFYGAHCDYFITNDNRCLAKAQKIYKQLKIKTAAVSLEEFIFSLNGYRCGA